MSNTVSLERNQRLSQSKLWQYQEKYFDQLGIDAWNASVPFYVTSNRRISYAYAQTAFGMMCDWIEQHPEDKDKVFYLIELGTGAGQFSYYVLQYLNECIENSGLSHTPQFCYVMTDFTLNNIKFWQQHEKLKPFVESGQLDFAQFNLVTDTKINLLNQQVEISSSLEKNPMIVFGNYIFDSIPSDAFYVEKSSIDELSINLNTPSDNINPDKSIKDLNKIDYYYTPKRIKPKKYYDDPALAETLTQYQTELDGANLLIPVAGIKSLSHLINIANQRLLLISSDKAYSALHEIQNAQKPLVSFHGSFSLMVNYDAIKRYLTIKGADCFIPTPRPGLKTFVSFIGATIESCPRLKSAINQHIEEFAPSDYFTTYRHFMDTLDKAKMPQILSLLALTHWDSYVFGKLSTEITKQLGQASLVTQNNLLAKLPIIAKNYFSMPGSADIHFNIAICYYSLGKHELALTHYDESKKTHGESSNLHYNRGLCYTGLTDNERATEAFQQTLIVEPGHKKALGWLTKLSLESD